MLAEAAAAVAAAVDDAFDENVLKTGADVEDS